MLFLGITIIYLYIISNLLATTSYVNPNPIQYNSRAREVKSSWIPRHRAFSDHRPSNSRWLRRPVLVSYLDDEKDNFQSIARPNYLSPSKNANDLSGRNLIQKLIADDNGVREVELSNHNYLLANGSDINSLANNDLGAELSDTVSDSAPGEDWAKTQTNNHQTSSLNGSANSRHYNINYQTGSNVLFSSNNNKYNPKISLNYVHSLLGVPNVKPVAPISSKLGPLTSMLNSNTHSAANSYSGQHYSMGSQQVSPPNKLPASSLDQGFPDEPSTFDDNQDRCGKQQVGYREPRIVGGNNTYEGEFPWAVSIQRHGSHHCGGVIVGKRWILTAAHCVRSQSVGNLLVRTGGHTLSRNINSLNSHLERDYFVEQIVMHGDFSRYDNLTATQMKSSANTNNADIALLRLRTDIAWNEFAWPVCFPHRESGNFSGHDAIVIGWGKLNEKSEEFSNELQKVKLTIIDNKLCQNWFRQAGREMPIDDRIICAGFKNGGKDACHGDSGGPLLSRINGRYVVVGVVSTGIGCARPLLPGLYSRVSSYISWIDRYVNK